MGVFNFGSNAVFAVFVLYAVVSLSLLVGMRIVTDDAMDAAERDAEPT